MVRHSEPTGSGGHLDVGRMDRLFLEEGIITRQGRQYRLGTDRRDQTSLIKAPQLTVAEAIRLGSNARH